MSLFYHKVPPIADRRLVVWLLAASLGLPSCRPPRKTASVVVGPNDPQVPPEVQAVGPNLQLDSLVSALKRMAGKLTTDGKDSWVLQGSAKLLAALAAHRDSAVVSLVACLGDEAPSRTTAALEPVPVGVLCYAALRRIAYYEWQVEPEFKNGWPGDLRPTASIEQLRAARIAWTKVVRQKRYSLL